MPEPLLSIEDARAAVLEAVAHTLGSERLAVELALGRVLAQDVSATGDVPPFACSAMDGYATGAGPAGRRLELAGESRAGSPYQGTLGAGRAIRISTGALVPADADAVIRQEDVRAGPTSIETLVELAPGANIRVAGEDMRAGAVVLTAGAVLDPPALGAAVAAGAGELQVARRPTVSLLSTGDELRAPGEPLGPGEIHNSNTPMLAALAGICGATVRGRERLRDELEATEAALASALEASDVVIVTGGVSVGPHDHVKPALARLGVQQRFWGVALQPGKPTWFGTRDQRLVFGLPGNPVSAVVTFTLFAAPALAALQGANRQRRPAGTARLSEPIRRRRERARAITVALELSAETTSATPVGVQESHLVTSMLAADALAMIPAGEGELGAGDTVALEPLPWSRLP